MRGDLQYDNGGAGSFPHLASESTNAATDPARLEQEDVPTQALMSISDISKQLVAQTFTDAGLDADAGLAPKTDRVTEIAQSAPMPMFTKVSIGIILLAVGLGIAYAVS